MMHEKPFGLAIRGLAKRFDRPAVDGLDLTVRARRVLRAARAERRRQDHDAAHGGRAAARPMPARSRVCGIDALADPVAAKQIMAWVSDEPMIYDKLTPFEYLEFVAGLWGIDAGARRRRARAS